RRAPEKAGLVGGGGRRGRGVGERVRHRRRCGGGGGRAGEEGGDPVGDFGASVGVVDLVTQIAAVAHTVREERGKLFHLADGVGHFGVEQAAKISGEQLVAVGLGGLVVAAG